MALIKWEPFGELEKFFDEDFFAPVFQKVSSDLAVDVYEKDNNIVAEMQIPGVDPKEINISIENNLLRVSGSRKEEKEEKKKNYYRKEIRKGAFERIVRLPAEVEEGKAEAEYKDGVLKIIVPKAKTKSKKISIKIK